MIFANIEILNRFDNLPKKVSEIKKMEIIESFLRGSNIKDIAQSYNFSVPTITRQLKNALGENKFNKIKKTKTKNNQKTILSELTSGTDFYKGKGKEEKGNSKITNNDFSEFVELEPLIEGVVLDKQKEVSSKPLKNVQFPKIVYLIVDKEIELKPKLLSDYPEWRFLPNEDLNRYTIEIFSEQKNAKMK